MAKGLNYLQNSSESIGHWRMVKLEGRWWGRLRYWDTANNTAEIYLGPFESYEAVDIEAERCFFELLERATIKRLTYQGERHE